MTIFALSISKMLIINDKQNINHIICTIRPGENNKLSEIQLKILNFGVSVFWLVME